MSTELFGLILCLFAAVVAFGIWKVVLRAPVPPDAGDRLREPEETETAEPAGNLLEEYAQIMRYMDDLEGVLEKSSALDESSRQFFEERRRRMGRLELRFASFTLKEEDPQIRDVMRSVLEDLERFQLKFIRT